MFLRNYLFYMVCVGGTVNTISTATADEDNLGRLAWDSQVKTITTGGGLDLS